MLRCEGAFISKCTTVFSPRARRCSHLVEEYEIFRSASRRNVKVLETYFADELLFMVHCSYGNGRMTAPTTAPSRLSVLEAVLI